ncbi:MAG: helix-turn-helix transcriptional regulator [Faecousia sp.]
MRLARLVAIVMLLLQHDKMSAAKLAERFEVTPRTIFRDIEAINLAGIPIVAYPGVNGGVSIMKQYKIEKGLFTTEDIILLLSGLTNMPISDHEMLNAVAKIKSLIPPELETDIESRAGQISIDYCTWQGADPASSIIRGIKAAMDKKQVIFFEYYNRNGEETRREAEPYQLFLKEGNWYLTAYCLLRKEFRTFRLSRMSCVTISEKTFVPREYKHQKTPSPPFETFRIKLKADRSLKRWFADFAGKERITDCGEDKIIIDFPFMESDYGYGLILQFGDKCECLEPQFVRDELERRANAICRLYRNKEDVPDHAV